MKRLLWRTLSMFILFWVPALSSYSTSNISIAVSHDIDITYLRRSTLQRIFTKKVTRWGNGQDITVIIKPVVSIEHRQFLEQVLKMTPYRYQKALDSVTYTAHHSTPVIEVSNDAGMMIELKKHPGAIGYSNYMPIMDGRIIRVCEDDELCL